MTYDAARDFLRAAAKGSPIWRYTASAVLIALCGFAYWALGGPPFVGFARGTDMTNNMTKLEQRVTGLEQAVTFADLKRERDYLEGRISQLGSDIFAAERDITDLELKGVPIPIGYRKQLREMQDEKASAEDRLERLIQANPRLAVRGVP